MASLTKKERVLAVLNGEIPDRVPIFDYLIHDGVFNHFGAESIPLRSDKHHIAACAKCLDLCHPLGGLPREPGRIINDDGSKTIVERWMSWNIPAPSQSLLTDSDGKIKEELEKQIEQCESRIGEAKPDAKKDAVENARSLEPYTGDMVYITAWACTALPYGNTERRMLAYADYPELVEKKMRLDNILTLERLQATAYKEISPVAIIWDDIAYKNRLFYPPDLLERLYFPALAEICGLFHSRDIRVLFHSDGDVTSVLPNLIDCGIDGLNPVETSAGMNYADIKRDYGDKITIVGGMDAVDVLALGSIDEVAAETKRLINIAGKSGGLIAASSSGQIDMSMPAENVVAFYETVWDYGRY
ncbi:MAG: hypothetical protein FWG34_09675 [Oscillospiraceae bacterium]|nr:hypothetical protein [Oscillospiraceae bacterium]